MLSGMVPWLRVALAVGIYVVVALAAAALIRKWGTDHRDMAGRTSSRVTLIGAAANGLILGLVLLQLVLLDRRPLGALGLGVSRLDVVATLLSLAVIAAVAAGALGVLHLRGTVRVARRGIPAAELPGLLRVMAVLTVVALQEEALYRGYVSVNLLGFGATTVVVTSTVVFAAIHLLTNRGGAAQMASWLLGGLTFVCIYLVSGSLWVAAALHLAIDAANVVALAIVGRYTVVTLEPGLSSGARAVIRTVTSAALVALFLGLYGPSIKLP